MRAALTNVRLSSSSQPIRQGLAIPSIAILLLVFSLFHNDNHHYFSLFAEAADEILFEPPEAIKVVAPTTFPKPTDMFDDNHPEEIVVIVKPTYGKHRYNADAVLAYAEGYPLQNYRYFLETLHATGFRGDVVLAIASKDLISPTISEYLKSYSEEFNYENEEENKDKMNVVIYDQELVCLEGLDLKTPTKRKYLPRSGSLDSFQLCRLDHVYGRKDPKTGEIVESFIDIRDGRVVQTLRYEWYWIWSLQYHPHSWLLLLDLRDSFFQTNPFVHLPRYHNTTNITHNTEDSGYLYFYGENHVATRLGQSKYNTNWITRGYGEETMKALADKPTICSGSTIGEQIAMETYLRAMVNEWDETDVKMAGSDQGFHNYLYYSSKLQNARSIKAIIVWEQGKGIINNLGAMRTKPLTDWGIYDDTKHEVYNWWDDPNNKTLSPVVHQWDRDKYLNAYCLRQRMKQLKDWKKE